MLLNASRVKFQKFPWQLRIFAPIWVLITNREILADYSNISWYWLLFQKHPITAHACDDLISKIFSSIFYHHSSGHYIGLWFGVFIALTCLAQNLGKRQVSFPLISVYTLNIIIISLILFFLLIILNMQDACLWWAIGKNLSIVIQSISAQAHL